MTEHSPKSMTIVIKAVYDLTTTKNDNIDAVVDSWQNAGGEERSSSDAKRTTEQFLTTNGMKDEKVVTRYQALLLDQSSDFMANATLKLLPAMQARGRKGAAPNTYTLRYKTQGNTLTIRDKHPHIDGASGTSVYTLENNKLQMTQKIVIADADYLENASNRTLIQLICTTQLVKLEKNPNIKDPQIIIDGPQLQNPSNQNENPQNQTTHAQSKAKRRASPAKGFLSRVLTYFTKQKSSFESRLDQMKKGASEKSKTRQETATNNLRPTLSANIGKAGATPKEPTSRVPAPPIPPSPKGKAPPAPKG